MKIQTFTKAYIINLKKKAKRKKNAVYNKLPQTQKRKEKKNSNNISDFFETEFV